MSETSGIFGSSRGASMLEVIYHEAVFEVRKQNGNALMALFVAVTQLALMVAVFSMMFFIMGSRGAPLRGDFMIYLFSGIALFMMHVRTVGAVAAAKGTTSPMMAHAPLTTAVTISASALQAAYIQVLSLIVVLVPYHVLAAPIHIADPVGAAGMFFLAWFSGLGVGLVLMVVKIWYPSVGGIITSTYQRINMIASGKMFVANTLPGFVLGFFDWNPLFHIIDQARGYIFINYEPMFTNWHYALYFGMASLVIGMLAEFYTRRTASLSWKTRN